MNVRIRNQVLTSLFRLGVFDCVTKWNRKKVVIVQYHGVTKSAGPYPGIENRKGKHLSEKKFLEQMRYLHARYRTVPLETIVSRIVRGAPLPDGCAAITFDDGYRNNYSVAYPILQRFNLPATIFVTTDFISGKSPLWVDRIEYALNKTRREALELNVMGRPIDLSLKNDRERGAAADSLTALLKKADQTWRSEVLVQLEEKADIALGGRRDDQGDYAPSTWDEIAEMQSGRLITIGSHTATHPILPQCSSEEIAHELVVSKALIESTLGRPCQHFCYPNGDFDARTMAEVRKAGHISAVCSMRGLDDSRTDPFAIKRIGVPARFSLAEFAARVSGGLLLLSRLKSMVVPPTRRPERS